MSAIVTALGGNASASIGDAVGQAMNLRLEQSVVCLDHEECRANDESIATAQDLIDKLETKIAILHELYREIEISDSPNSYFDAESVEELKDADVMVRAFEEMLRIQFEGMVRRVGNREDATLSAAKQLRRTVAKLRKTVSSFLSIHNQLKENNLGDYAAYFEFSDQKVAMLKAATEAAASGIH
ncbi:hypothetical protein [Vibrio fluvialis]|uniref:hypothetical protein n=1 Tax=Vibrio fluvialis TaxID=676 RepID=UPI00140514E1|nr:hypothetical protein [Vibrio fluvialis]NHN75627.1 hypothetical protein [Vibrio fluvialis]